MEMEGTPRLSTHTARRLFSFWAEDLCRAHGSGVLRHRGHVAVGQDQYHFGVGELTTHFRTYFSGDWDVHSGYDLDFDPWPCLCGHVSAAISERLSHERLPALNSFQ